MLVTFRCRFCKNFIHVNPVARGRRIMCGKCGRTITVPSEEISGTFKKVLSVVFALMLVGCASKEKGSEMKKEAGKTVKTEKMAAEKKVESKVSDGKEMAKKSMDEGKAKKASMAGDLKGTVCSLAGDQRSIDVQKKKQGGCEVVYTKFGETSSIASAVADVAYCEQVRERVVTNLSNAGFSCQ